MNCFLPSEDEDFQLDSILSYSWNKVFKKDKLGYIPSSMGICSDHMIAWVDFDFHDDLDYPSSLLGSPPIDYQSQI